MKADIERARTDGSSSSVTQYVGRFVRRTGNFGTACVVGSVTQGSVEIIEEPGRLFPRDGLVETVGVLHAHLKPDDWIVFDVVKNTRPRGPEWKVAHLHQLPRFAVLAEASVSAYRTLLTVDGWSGEKRTGLWALRISGDRVLVVELIAGKDGLLRLSPEGGRKVRWLPYRDVDVVSLNVGSRLEPIYLGDHGQQSESFDWSHEADHVARVIRSLEDVNDPRVNDIISWLDLHHEDRTGRIFAATDDHAAAEAALRSGELAERLRADKQLMKAYLDAAVENPEVRNAIAQHAREGEGAERAELRARIERELASERDRQLTEIETTMAAARAEAVERLDGEQAARQEALLAAHASQEAAAKASVDKKVAELAIEFDAKRVALQSGLDEIEQRIASTRDAEAAASAELSNVRSAIVEAEATLKGKTTEIDRLLAISSRLSATVVSETEALPGGPTVSAVGGPRWKLSDLPPASFDDKRMQIDQQVLLSGKGKDLLRKLIALLLAGELPIVFGRDANDFLEIAGSLICPGRAVDMEADPTLMSIEDIWARPGSGSPTMMATAAAAADGGGTVLVVIRSIERSGARFWMPALADALRRGTLPRGLLVCCTASEESHEELDAIPLDTFALEAEGVFSPGAYLGAPSLLASPALRMTALDPGTRPVDLSAASAVLTEIGFEATVGQALRIARVFKEAEALLGSDADARTITIELADSMNKTEN